MLETQNDIGALPFIGTTNLLGTISTSDEGLADVIVDLVDSESNLYSSITSDASGFYQFLDVPNGDYTVSIVTPLGYIADYDYRVVTLTGIDITVDFNLTPIEITGEQRGAGFWKHQINVYTSGHGNAEIPEYEFSEYLNTVGVHFSNNPVNPIALYSVEQPADHLDSLEEAASLLSIHGNVPMVYRARQQLMTLLLNIVSVKLHQHAEISVDGATASQAITYCYSLITDVNDSNDELAKDIAEQVNSNVTVATGVIPLSTPNIAYKGCADGIAVPKTFELSQNFPNPFNAQTTIKYSLPEASHVTINVYDLLGRNVATIVNEQKQPGYHQTVWNSHSVSSGIFFYKIQAGDFTEKKKMLLLK